MMLMSFSACSSVSGGTPETLTSLEESRSRLQSAVEHGDSKTVYSMLSDDERQKFSSYKAFQTVWKDNLAYIRDVVGTRSHADLYARLELADGGHVTMKWKDGRWYVVSAPELTGGGSPSETVTRLISAFQAHDMLGIYSVMLPEARKRLEKRNARRLALLRQAMQIIKRRPVDSGDSEISIEVGNSPRLRLTLIRVGNQWLVQEMIFQ